MVVRHLLERKKPNDLKPDIGISTMKQDSTDDIHLKSESDILVGVGVGINGNSPCDEEITKSNGMKEKEKETKISEEKDLSGKVNNATKNNDNVHHNGETNNTSNSISDEPNSSTKTTKNSNKNKSSTKSSTTRTTKRTKKSKEDTSLEFIWICTECREAECPTHPDSPLLVCEGPCKRPFHYPCAGLSSLPPSDETWICNDCKAQKHKCFVCHEYGVDGDDVHKCDKGDCGLFYHLSCLSMYDVDVMEVPIISSDPNNNVDGDDDNDMDEMNGIIKPQQTRPKFTCPAHKCWTCSGGPPPENPTCTPCPLPQCNDGDTTKNGGDKKSKQQKGKRKRGKAKKESIFAEKKEKGLFRCLDCPISYHISCIPPSCRFHELALLCHEHAYTSRLPYLDLQNSIQKGVEDRADRMARAVRGKKKDDDNDELLSLTKKRMKSMLGNEQNPFLPGKTFMNGDGRTRQDNQMLDLLMSSDEYQTKQVSKQSLTSFCLPCGIQDEVYSKPPVYNKISNNRYDPKHRPKRHPPTKEQCQCIGSCDEHCMNRMLGIECVGDKKSPYWNCECGVDCGNRLLSKKQVAKCRPQREQGKGWGLITVNGVQKGELVEEYVGEIVDEKTKRERLETWAKDHPNDPNFYLMQLEPGWYIDARVKGGLSRFINHSCDPNCDLVPVIVSGYTRIAIVANQNIGPGEFLKYDYHFDTQDGDKFSCRCGAKNCRGTMKGGQAVEDDVEKKLTKTELWSAAKAKLERDKKFLESVFIEENERLFQTGAALPGEKLNSSQSVANGPDLSAMNGGQQYGVCLKRNVGKGSNFASRYWRMRKNKSI